MKNNYLYSLEDVLNNGVYNESGKLVFIDKIVIPKIQRSYAQGRESESTIREKFVKSIFDAILNGTVLEMSFVYGSLNSGELALLDGQQRLTTLYLLYWYVAKRENEALPDYLLKFVYETRHTSTDFLRHLNEQSHTYIVMNGSEKPSKAIRRNKWYTVAYEEDPTVDSMIRMLDYIDEQYSIRCKEPVYANLKNLMFYVLLLENFGLTEELYIKMNSRGLFLVPFENFKADLVKFIRSCNCQFSIRQLNGQNIGFKDFFAIQLDSKYIDIFWKPGSTDYAEKYFRFFSRFMASLGIWNTQLAAKAYSQSGQFGFFDSRSETEQKDKYLGFEPYSELLDGQTLEDIDRVLERLHTHYVSNIKPNLAAPWGKEWDLFEDEKAYQRTHKAAFAAVMDYLIHTNEFDPDAFAQWMRVVWNIIENSNIDGPEPQINTIRSLHELINLGAANAVYATLATYTITNGTPRAIQEEVEKARIIDNNPNVAWEAAFKEAEKHQFFKGMIRFFMGTQITLPAFTHRYDIVSKMFNADGIAPSFRAEHILIRAMMSQLNDWADLEELSFTERNESGNFLKLMLARSQKLWTFYGNLLDTAKSLTDITNLLSQTIRHQYVELLHGTKDDNLQRAFDRLVHDVNLYNWINHVEDEHNGWHFRIYSFYDHYFVAVPKKWYARMMIDTDRKYIIPMLLNTFNMEYEDPAEAIVFDEYRDFFGNDVKIIGNGLQGHRIRVSFNTSHQVVYSVQYALSELSNLQAKYPNSHVNDYDQWMDIYYDTYNTISDYTRIENSLRIYMKEL